MTISYVGGQTAGRAGATSTLDVTFALTGGSDATPQAGDLVIIACLIASQGRTPSAQIAGYTNLTQVNVNGTTYDTSIAVSYKFMGATPDTLVTIPSTGNIADAQRWTIQVFRGVDPNTPMDVTPVTATATGTVLCNPGGITPVTEGAWVVACGGGAAQTGSAYSSSFLSGFLAGSSADTNDAQLGAGYYSGWVSGAVDPPAFSGGSVNAANSWGAYTLALRPALPLLVNTSELFAPTVSPGPVSLSAPLLTNTSTLYGPTVAPGPVDLALPLLVNASELFAPTVASGLDMQVSWVVFDTQDTTQYLQPPLLENANTLYAPAVTPGPISLAPPLMVNTNVIFGATVTGGAIVASNDDWLIRSRRRGRR